jgi:hypothetical protein
MWNLHSDVQIGKDCKKEMERITEAIQRPRLSLPAQGVDRIDGRWRDRFQLLVSYELLQRRRTKMTTDELIEWLKENSSGIYRPAYEAAERLEQMQTYLKMMADCNLNETNCASLEVASKRVRNMANMGLR